MWRRWRRSNATSSITAQSIVEIAGNDRCADCHANIRNDAWVSVRLPCSFVVTERSLLQLTFDVFSSFFVARLWESDMFAVRRSSQVVVFGTAFDRNGRVDERSVAFGVCNRQPQVLRYLCAARPHCSDLRAPQFAAMYEARMAPEQRPNIDSPLDVRIAFATAKYARCLARNSCLHID